MNLRDLRYLVSVADLQHFGRAAEACHVSQPTLSAQIRKLEEQLGVTVFERGHRQLRVTNHGQEIIARARQIVLEADELVETAQQLGDPLSGQIRLGFIHTLGPYLLPKIMKPIREALPKLECLLVEDQTARLLNRLANGEIDAALLALPVDNPGLTITPLFEEAFVAALPAGHALSQKDRITVRDLKPDSLLLLEDGHCLRDQALEACTHRHAPQERNDFRATSLETLRHMVAAGSGITLMPALASRPDAEIAFVPFAQPQPSRQIGIVSRLGSARHLALAKLADVIRNALQGQHHITVEGTPHA